MKSDLKKPCDRCPFRIEPYFPLDPERIIEFAEMDGLFPCHKTLEYDEDVDENIKTEESQLCAGWVTVHRNQGTANQMLRIIERLGGLDWDSYDHDVECYEDFLDYVDLAEENES